MSNVPETFPQWLTPGHGHSADCGLYGLPDGYPEFDGPPAAALSPTTGPEQPERRERLRCSRLPHLHRRENLLTLWGVRLDEGDLFGAESLEQDPPVDLVRVFAFPSRIDAARQARIVGGRVVLLASPSPIRVCGLWEFLARVGLVAWIIALIVAATRKGGGLR